jgi:fructokinase
LKLISIGEVLWDLLPGAEHLGGAPFNFALHARHLGHQVCFVSAVGHDRLGHRALERMEEAGLSVRFVSRNSQHPTGTATVALDDAGVPQFHIHRPAAYDFPALEPADFHALLTPQPEWIYFGTLQQMSSPAHELTMRLLCASPAARHFYDVNLRPGCFTPELVRGLARHAHVLKLNEQELPVLAELGEIRSSSREEFCRDCARVFDLEAVCITRGPTGCALLLRDQFLEARGFRVRVADTIGAGDAFSAALLHGIAAGWSSTRIADFANRVGALVASRPGGTPKWTAAEAMSLTM